MGTSNLTSMGASRRVSALALLLYAGFVAYQSLADGGQWQCGGAILSMHARVSRSDLLANVVAYVPLGLLFVLATSATSERGWRSPAGWALLGVLGLAVLSAGLELLQSCQSARVSSALDWGANVAGGILGATIALLLRTAADRLPARVSHHHSTPYGGLRALTALVAVAWIVSQTMPWVFAVDVGTMRSNLSFLQRWSHGPLLDDWRVIRHAGAWIALACACRLVARDARVAAAGFVVTGSISLVLQVLLDARAPLSYEELIGMAGGAALVLPLMLLARQDPRPGRWALGLFCGALLTVAAYELRPDPSAIAAAHAFSWWPRVGLGGLLGALDYALLFGWFGLAAVAAGRWADVAGYRHARHGWPALAVLATLGLEIVQTGIPGRGPDVSAPVFTLLAVLGANACIQYGGGRSAT